MLRNMTLAVTSVLALTAAQAALAQSGSPEASTGTGSEVASHKQLYYETHSPAASTDPAIDSMSINMPMDTFKAFANARGEPMMTRDGTELGTVAEVDFNAQGNPELVVELRDNVAIDADRLVVTILPNNVSLTENRLVLDTTLQELALKAQKSGIRETHDLIDVTIF